jgi:transmembrane sensor
LSTLSPFTQLLQKYLAGQASAAEAEEMFHWLRTSPEAQGELEKVADEEAVIRIQRLSRSNHTQEPADEKVAPWLSERMERNILERIVAGPATEVVPLPAETGQWRLWFSRVAASLVLLVGIGLVVYRLGSSGTPQPLRYLTHITAPGQTATLSMPDGSTVRLNEASRIEYPAEFTAQAEREVRLSGEAFFEVAKDAHKPFVIQTGATTIRVLGTAFNVRENRHDTSVTVAVREGRVAFASQQDTLRTNILLQRGEVGVWKSRRMQQVNATQPENYLSWYNGRLLFRNTPLNEVIQQLTSIYDVPIELKNPELASLRFTANMKREALPEVMEQVALSLNLGYTQKGKTFIFYKK